MAFVTVSRPHLKQLASKGSYSAQRVLKLKETPERTLSVLQIGITLVGAISAAVGGAGAEKGLSPIIQSQFNLDESTAEGIAIFLIVIPLTYLSVVIGELVPKTFALKYPMKLALWGGLLLQMLDKFFSPIVFILEISTKIILKLISKGMSADKLFSPENTSVDLEPLSDVNKQYVLNLISVDKRTVKDIFVPLDEVSMVDITDDYRFITKKIMESRHTRLPVINNENVIGLIHAKEFFAEAEVSKLDWTQLIRPIMKISSKDPILAALKKLQSKNNHLALVTREDIPVGIVTIEDIFEEVVGDISEEAENPNVLLSSNSKIRTMNLSKKK